MIKHRQGFTLVEVLVVVAIIALLAAITIPSYQMNTTKARVANVIPALDVLMSDILKGYATNGSAPSSIKGVSGDGAGSYGPYMVPNATTNMHYVNGENWNSDGAMITVTVPDSVARGVPGFVESTNGSDGAYNSIAMAFYDNNGTLMMFCGRWDSNDPLYIPPEYLPSGCDSDNIQVSVSAN